MHYYKFNIADYRKDTAHLSRLEHSIYRDLIDWYYLDETPIPTDLSLVIRKLRLQESEHQSLLNVISDFFEKTEEGYFHKRIEKELDIYQARSLANRENGKKGGKPKQSEPNANPMGYDSPPNRNLNHKPLTNNHKPITNIKKNMSDKSDESREIFDFWLDVMGKTGRTAFSQDRKTPVQSRLKDGYSVEEIKQAILNCSKSEYHMTNGYNDLTLICRNASKLESFRDMSVLPKIKNIGAFSGFLKNE